MTHRARPWPPRKRSSPSPGKRATAPGAYASSRRVTTPRPSAYTCVRNSRSPARPPRPRPHPAVPAPAGPGHRPRRHPGPLPPRPLGRLTSAHLRELAAIAAQDGAGELRMTPWRGVVLPGLSPETAGPRLRELAAAGLVTDPASPWYGLGACTGRPGCAKSLADVRADAVATLRAGRHRAAARPLVGLRPPLRPPARRVGRCRGDRRRLRGVCTGHPRRGGRRDHRPHDRTRPPRRRRRVGPRGHPHDPHHDMTEGNETQ